MEIELLVVPDCPHEAAAAELITTAVAETGVQATVTHTVITSQDQVSAYDPTCRSGYGLTCRSVLASRPLLAR